MSTTNTGNLDQLDAIDETLISIDEHPKNTPYFYMFLITTPLLMVEYFFLLNKFNTFIEWAHHL